MICAETFGCSGKSPYFETHRFAELAGLSVLGNYSSIAGTTLIASIDRVSRCALDWRAFAEIALSHASRDIEVGLGIPSHALVCFEFGDDADSDDKVALVKAVREATASRGIQLGKCHSALTGSDVTSLVVTLIGERSKRDKKLGSHGFIWISGPIGFAKLLYLEGLKQEPDEERFIQALTRPLDLRQFGDSFPVMSDVSGHGLAGCLCDLAQRHSIEIDVHLTADSAASFEAVGVSASLLENDLVDYPAGMLVVAEQAKSLSLLKETSGPIIALSNELSSLEFEDLLAAGWRKLGSFRNGPASVSIGWSK